MLSDYVLYICRLTVTFSMNVPITQDMEAYVVITNLTKTRTPDNISLPISCSPLLFQNSGVWTQNIGQLVVKLASPISLKTQYTLSFVLANPFAGQPSPSISISFQGLDVATGVVGDIIPILPVIPATDYMAPLVVGSFTVLQVEQQTSSATLYNQIYVSFATTISLAVSTTVSVSNLVGSMLEMGVVRGVISSDGIHISQIVLDSTASTTYNFYAGLAINVKGVFTNISQYSGATQIATLSPPIAAVVATNKDYYYIATNSSQSIQITCDGLTGCDYGLTAGYMDMVGMFLEPSKIHRYLIHTRDR